MTVIITILLSKWTLADGQVARPYNTGTKLSVCHSYQWEWSAYFGIVLYVSGIVLPMNSIFRFQVECDSTEILHCS